MIIRILLRVALLAPLAFCATLARAEDTFEVAIGQIEIWSGVAPVLGQKAGIFKKYGINLDIFGTAGAGETVQAIIAGSADFGINVGTAGVLRAFAKGAPIRIIGANFTGAGDVYWYVRSDSPIKSLKDLTDKNTISYSTSGSTTNNVVLGFGKELGVKAKPTSTGGMSPTLTLVMSGQIDVGWGSPPFGIKEIDEGKIRVIASGAEVPSLRSQTVRVEVVNANTLHDRHDAVMRFVQAFRETLDWMYSDPAAMKMYADSLHMEVGPVKAAIEKFQPKSAKQFDQFSTWTASWRMASRTSSSMRRSPRSRSPSSSRFRRDRKPICGRRSNDGDEPSRRSVLAAGGLAGLLRGLWPKVTMAQDDGFPSDFVWGASTSSYQIEGAVEADGAARASGMSSATRRPIKGGDNGDVACDHYHRWREDIELLANGGFKAYRFSTAWPRILPAGSGAIEPRGLDFYDRLVDGLIAHGIAPWLCLYHWDLPQALQEQGGWLNRDIAEKFADYARIVAKRLGDRVKHWVTFNEPNIHALFGHGEGGHAPGIKGLPNMLAAIHHQSLAHGRAIRRCAPSVPTCASAR